MTDETPRLHIDSDWKAQAQAEKERLASKEASKESARAQRSAAGHGGELGGGLDGDPMDQGEQGEGGRGEMPPADFHGLIMTLGSQAMMGLGAYADPQTGRAMIDLAGAQFAIDLLGVIEVKTKGNLTPEEASEFNEILVHLRSRFVQVAQLVAEQMQREALGGQGLGGPGMGGPGMGMPGMGGVSGAAGGARPAAKSGLIIPD